ncbi:MAG: LysM peptidoglycan-binding domain-containing protein [Verrucomicrobiota bacterium]
MTYSESWRFGLARLVDSVTGFSQVLGISHAGYFEETMNIVNPSNPFQIPSCLQRADSQQRRREHFKRGFIAAVVAIVILLVGLLIEGCMSEQATTTPLPAKKSAQATGVPASWTTPALAVEQKPKPAPQPNFNATSQNPAVVSKEPAATASQTETLYVVKSGDSLTRIAKAHGTTVRALKAANDLQNDRIVVGAKLKIPTA